MADIDPKAPQLQPDPKAMGTLKKQAENVLTSFDNLVKKGVDTSRGGNSKPMDDLFNAMVDYQEALKACYQPERNQATFNAADACTKKLEQSLKDRGEDLDKKAQGGFIGWMSGANKDSKHLADIARHTSDGIEHDNKLAQKSTAETITISAPSTQAPARGQSQSQQTTR